MLVHLTLSLVCLLIFGLLLFVLAIIKKDNSVADMGWGLGFILVSFASAPWPISIHKAILLTIVTLWGARLFFRILRRKLLRPGEDPRYAKWRSEWHFFYLRSYLQIFFLQPFLLCLNSSLLVLYFANNYTETTSFSFSMLAGLVIWSMGFIIEVVADYQLDHFYKQRSVDEKFCQKGLWKYSRHPNYFGEILLWWGIAIYVAPTIGWEWAIIGPLTITTLLLFVSGIPLAEERLKNDELYKIYKKRTSVLIPWFNRKEG